MLGIIVERERQNGIVYMFRIHRGAKICYSQIVNV